MKNVEDIYPASPMQEVMLLHALTHAGDDALFNQFCFDIRAPVEAVAFLSAWQQVVARHAALRTAFVWEKVKRPMQVVRKNVSIDLVKEDLRDFDPDEQERRFAAWCERDRARHFDLMKPPLMRVALLQLGSEHWRFVWSSHHLILDRWCLDTLLGDFDRAYQDALRGNKPAAQRAPAFREYIKWIGEQDSRLAASYWRNALAELTSASTITRTGAAPVSDNAERRINTERLDGIRSLARECRVTPGIIVQAGWALTLNRLTRRQDVVFGATVSGRPHEVPHVEDIVGSFVNNVPVRCPLPADATVRNLLGDIQTAQQRRAPFEYLSPVDIQRHSAIAHGQPMFDSILVWLAATANEHHAALHMSPLRIDYGTAYPFTISVREAANHWHLHGTLTRQCGQSAGELLDALLHSLDALVAAGRDARLDALEGFAAQDNFSAPAGLPHAASSPSFEEEETAGDGPDRREAVPAALLTDFLEAEWQQALGHDRFDEDQDFFAAGGDSMQAAALHTRIEAGMRQNIPIIALFRRPTVQHMAETLANGEWPTRQSIAIAVRAQGRGRPLFCVASSEVNTVGYSMLTRHLHADRPVFVLQAPPNPDGPNRAQPDELPALATRYVAAMRKIQPAGPYDLLGMCGGAHIAGEMTRALEANGDRAAFLGVVNTWAFYTISRLYYLNRWANIGRYYLRRLRQLLPSGASSAPAPAHATPPVTATAAVPAQDEIGLDSAWIRDVGFAYRDPRRPRIASHITVFRIAPQQYWRIRGEDLGWSKVSGQVNVVHLPGDAHDDILREPHVRHIAREIEKQLTDVPGESTSAPSRQPIVQTGNST